MGGICEQDDKFYCPVKSDKCAKGNLSKPCILLYSATTALYGFAQLGLNYEIVEGSMKLTRHGKPYVP
jgi:hypothetical protein